MLPFGSTLGVAPKSRSSWEAETGSRGWYDHCSEPSATLTADTDSVTGGVLMLLKSQLPTPKTARLPMMLGEDHTSPHACPPVAPPKWIGSSVYVFRVSGSYFHSGVRFQPPLPPRCRLNSRRPAAPTFLVSL